MPHIDANGARLYYELEGDGDKPVLILSNSLGTNLHMWDGQMAAFKEHFQVLRYDSRGHGKSEAGPGPYTIEQLGRDVLDLAAKLNIEKFRYCGLSKGGNVGQWLGVNAPEKLEKLVLCNTASWFGPPDLWQARITQVRGNGMGDIVDNVIERWFSQSYIQSKNPEIERIAEMLRTTPAEGYAACCEALRDVDLRDDIKSIQTPTFIIAGEVDPATDVSKAEYIHSQIKGSHLEVIPGVAHLSNVEKPEVFTRHVLDFLLA